MTNYAKSITFTTADASGNSYYSSTEVVDPAADGTGVEPNNNNAAGTTGGVANSNTSVGDSYTQLSALYLGCPTVFRNINFYGGSIYSRGYPVAFQNVGIWGNQTNIYGGSGGSSAVSASAPGTPVAATSTSQATSGGSSVWWFNTGSMPLNSGAINIYGGNASDNGTTGTFTGDSHVTVAGLSTGFNIRTLVGGNNNGANLTGNTNVDINAGGTSSVSLWGGTAPAAASPVTTTSNGVNANIGVGSSDWASSASPSASQNKNSSYGNGVVLGGSTSGNITGNTNLTIQNTPQISSIGSVPQYTSNTVLSGQSTGSGMLTGGNLRGTVNGNTNLNISGVGKGTWIPQIAAAGIGATSGGTTVGTSTNITAFTSSTGAFVNGNVYNRITAPAVYGIYFGGVLYGNIAGTINNQFSSAGAFGLNIGKNSYSFNPSGAAAGETTSSGAYANQNGNFGENIVGNGSVGGVYGNYIGGSMNGNVGTAGSTTTAINNYYDSSSITDGFSFFAGGNNGIMQMGTYNYNAWVGSGGESFVYGVSSGTISGDIVNTVKAGTTCVSPGSSTPPSNSYSWAGDLEGFTGGNGVQATPLTGYKLISSNSPDSKVNPTNYDGSNNNGSSGQFVGNSGALNNNLSLSGSGAASTVNSGASTNALSRVNGNIYSTLRSGIFSIGNSAANASSYVSSGVQNAINTDYNTNYLSDNTWNGIVRGGSTFGYDNGNTYLNVGTEGVVSSTWGYAYSSSSTYGGLNASGQPTISYTDTSNTRGDASAFELTGSGGGYSGDSNTKASFETQLSNYVQNGNSTVILGASNGQTANQSGAIAAVVWGAAFNGYQLGNSNVYVNSGIYGSVLGGGRNPGVQWGNTNALMVNGQINSIISGGAYDTDYTNGNSNTEVDGGVVNGSVVGTAQVTGTYRYSGGNGYVPFATTGSTNVLITAGDFTGSPIPGQLYGKTIAGGPLNGSVQGSATLSVDATKDTAVAQYGTAWVPLSLGFNTSLPFIGGSTPMQTIVNNYGNSLNNTTNPQLGSGSSSTITVNIYGNSTLPILQNAQIEGDAPTVDETRPGSAYSTPTYASNQTYIAAGNYLANYASNNIFNELLFNANQLLTPTGQLLTNNNFTDYTNIGSMQINVNAPMDNFGNIFASSYPLGDVQDTSYYKPNNLGSLSKPSSTSPGLQYNTQINIKNAGQVQNISGGFGYAWDPSNTIYTGSGTMPQSATQVAKAGTVPGGMQMTAKNAPMANVYSFGSPSSTYVNAGRGVDNFTKAIVGANANTSTIILGNQNGTTATAGQTRSYVAGLIENFTNLNVTPHNILTLGYNPNTNIAAAAADPFGNILNGSGAMVAVGTPNATNATSYLTNVAPYEFGTTVLGDGSGIYADQGWGNPGLSTTQTTGVPVTPTNSTAIPAVAGTPSIPGSNTPLSQQMYLGSLMVIGAVQFATPYLTTDREINLNSIMTMSDTYSSSSAVPSYEFTSNGGTGDTAQLSWLAQNIGTSPYTAPSNGLSQQYVNGYYWGTTQTGMPIFSMENTSSAANGIESLSPTNVVGVDENSQYGYGLVADTDYKAASANDVGNANGSLACTSDTVYIAPGQIREFEINSSQQNTTVGQWQISSALAQEATSDLTQLHSGNYKVYSTTTTTAGASYIQMMWEGQAISTGTTNAFTFTTNGSNYLTNVQAMAPVNGSDTSASTVIYDYKKDTNATTSRWPSNSWTPTSNPLTNGAPTSFNPWAAPWNTSPTETFFPGNSDSGTYVGNPGTIYSRFIIYNALTDTNNSLAANNIILTDSEAQNLSLAQLESSSYQPTFLTGSSAGQNLTYTGVGNVTTTPGITAGAGINGSGINGTSVLKATLSDGSDALTGSGGINAGLNGSNSYYRTVTVTWSDGLTNAQGQPTTITSLVTIVPDNTQIINGTAVVFGQDSQIDVSQAHAMTSQAQLFADTNVQVINTSGQVQGAQVTIYNDATHPSTYTSNGTTVASYDTGDTANSNPALTTLSQLQNSKTGDEFSLYYSYSSGGTTLISAPVTVQITNGIVQFNAVPTTVDFGSWNIQTSAISAPGTLENNGGSAGAQLTVSDTRTNSDAGGQNMTGWLLAVQEQPLTAASVNNSLAGNLWYGTTNISSSGPTVVDGMTAADELAVSKGSQNTYNAPADTPTLFTLLANPTNSGTIYGTEAPNPVYSATGSGLHLEIPAKAEVAGTYTGSLHWTLELAPQGNSIQ